MKSLDKLAGFTGKIIIPFGLALLLEALILKGLPLKSSVVNSSTALLGMLPKGIALLTITSLLTAVIKLGLKKVLVQEMYSVETCARGYALSGQDGHHHPRKNAGGGCSFR